MNQAIFHRGPDQDGFYSDQNCTLAMRRLSIIDLHTGKQPIYSNTRRSLIFFNGEIYNYRELKEGLVAKGYTFNTTSDTEVIVNLFECYGTEMLLMLKGMFAFCIYDMEKNSYLFARDRFGEKPFFYHHGSGEFSFSSELNSLLYNKNVPRKLNKSQVSVYLRRSFVPEPDTLFEGIKILPAGHYLLLDKDKISIHPYFKIEYKPDNAIKTLEEAASFVKPFLIKAVQRQMVSDVPIGAFLSGGIDSSTVVALMQKFSDRPIKTFNVKFQTEGYDESKLARKVAEKVGTEHHEIVVEDNGFSEDQFWKILEHVGVPFPDSSAIPTDIVTHIISKHVKVALSGDGGDELFAGYTMFDWLSSINKLKMIPQPLRRAASFSLRTSGRVGLGNNFTRRVGKALEVSEMVSLGLLEEVHALFDRKETAAVYGLKDVWGDEIAASKWNEWSDLRKAMYYRVKYDLTLDMLIKVDRMSMSNSLEVRNPFLDPDLFEASTQLPDQFLRSRGVGKLVIRKIMENELPEEVFNHPKSGFSIPLHNFKNKEFRELAQELLEALYMKEIFHADVINEILRIGLNEMKDSATGSIYRKTHQLWSLMMFSGWIKMYNVELA
jgi:asparagine synthase (glutamine-hydrolysing)